MSERLTNDELTAIRDVPPMDAHWAHADLVADMAAELLNLRARVAELEEARHQIAAKLGGHRGSSTRGLGGQYKNPVRQGYDRGLTDALALLGIDMEEKKP